jgi:hypothetical protein
VPELEDVRDPVDTVLSGMTTDYSYGAVGKRIEDRVSGASSI